MAKDDELERRAIEELLKETNRARIRAETMGPTGWLKCPLRSTNKRFLLNTLRSTGLQRRTGEPRDAPSPTRGRRRDDSPVRNRDRSRTPSTEHRSSGGRKDHKHHHKDSSNNSNKRQDRDREMGYRHNDRRDRRHSGETHNRDKRQSS